MGRRFEGLREDLGDDFADDFGEKFGDSLNKYLDDVKNYSTKLDNYDY